MRQTIFTCLVFAAILCNGCTMMHERVIANDGSREPQVYAPQSALKDRSDQNSYEMKRRFEVTENEEQTAVHSAVLWAQKYEELSLRNNELREQNNKLFLENNRLDRETEKLSMELEQTKKELAEANAFLQQMHLELNEWKTDVLGFRDEIRQSQTAQLEALGKILSVLGAEPVTITDTVEAQPTDGKDT